MLYHYAQGCDKRHSIVNRNPVDPCDPDLVTDLWPNEMIELYIDEEGKNPISNMDIL